MSLVVWLPLNGDLTNQGLSNVTVTNNGATVDNNGKIGKCYSFDGVDDYIQISPMTLDLSCASICGWIKWGGFNSWSRMFDFQNSASGSTGAIGIANNGPSSTITVFGRTSSGASLPDTDIDLYAVANTWYHIALILDNTTAKVYVNGDLTKTFTLNSALGVMTLNNNYLGKSGWPADKFFQGSMNDFRIYDHCLSPKEVKELSKGLVLHYRLAGPGQENLTKNTYDWKNYSVDGSGQSNIGSYSVKDGICHIIDSNSNTRFYYNQGEKVPINGTSTYTISIKYKWVSGTDKTFRWQLQGFNGNSQIATIWSSSLSTTVWHGKSGEWQLIECPFNFNNSSINELRIYIQDGADYTTYTHEYYLKDMKLEEGSVATPWCPAPGDTLYTALGYNNNIEYDCSGYRRNGTKSGIITWDIDSPRYTTSYKFNNNTSIVADASNFYNIFNSLTYTINFWTKVTTYQNWGTMLRIAETDGQNKQIHLGMDSGTTFSVSYYDNDTQMSSFNTNEWHMMTVTSNSRGLISVYKDGILQQTTSKPLLTIGTNAKLMIGRDILRNSCQFIGNMSDFRIYATTLSAEDIAELYHSAVIVDNTGKSYAYEYFEAQ